MAILLACSCGKQLRVNDEFAGRRVKCPECQNILAVPSNGAGYAVTAAPSSRPGTKANGVVRFTCKCGKQMQAKSEHAGKRTKCPGCGAAVPIPGGSQETVDFVDKGKLGSRPAPSGKKWLDDEARDEDDRPHKRKPAAKGQRLLWPWVAGIAALVLIGGGVGAWLLFFQGGKKSSEVAKGKPDPKAPNKGQEGKAFADLGLVPGDAMAFVTLRVGDWWKTPSGKEFEKALAQIPDLAAAEAKFGMKLSDVERVTQVLPTDNPDDWWVILSTSKPLDEKKIVAEIKAMETKFQGKSYYASPQGAAIHFAGPTMVLVAGKAAALQKVLATPPRTSGPLSEKVQLAKDSKYHFVAGFEVPQSLGQKMKLATAGGRGGQGPDFSALAELQSGSITAILGAETQINMRLKFPDDARAANAKKTAEGLLALAKLFLPGLKTQVAQAAGPQAAQATEVFNQLEQTVNSLKINQEGSTLSIPLQLKVNLGTVTGALLLPAVQKVRSAAERTVVINNMRQLGIAMHNYNDTYKHLPPAEFEGGLSWRVAILPFIEQDALYKQFHLNEPWDSPHNIKLLEQMPKVFAAPERVQAKPGMTFVQVFAGPNTPFNGKIPSSIPRSFPDGTSNTILIVEAGEAVPWTKPHDLPYDPLKPLPRLGGMFPGNFFHAVMADASVIRLDRTRLRDATLRAAITPAGAEPLGVDWQDAQR